MQIYLTTTGTLSTVLIPDLGKIVFIHPIINLPLVEPLGEFTEKDIANSADLILAVTAGTITLTNVNGTVLTSLDQISSITTVGTITTGIWNGTAIPISHGGTGALTANNALNNLLPVQSGNNTLILGTDGFNASWVPNSGSATKSLQQTYVDSTTPEITTNIANGALTLRRGSSLDTDKVLDIQNGAGVSTFCVAGEGTTSILNSTSSTKLIIAPSIVDPSIEVKTPTVYTETLTSSFSDNLRAYFNTGISSTSGYINLRYDGAAPVLNLLDMDDDPCYIEFNTARIGLSTPGPGTFTTPTIINKFGARSIAGVATSGFSWLTNKSIVGGALTEILSCDSNFLKLPSVTTAERPASPSNGMLVYNSTLGKIDTYENSAWTQYVNTTTTQVIAGNKTFTGKISGSTNIIQYYNATPVTTTSNIFATITGMSLVTTNTVVSKYRVAFTLNIKHSNNNNTSMEIQILVNGVLDSTSLYAYSAGFSATPFSITFEKIYTNVTSPTTYAIQWRRVSGSTIPTVTTKSFIVQEIL